MLTLANNNGKNWFPHHTWAERNPCPRRVRRSRWRRNVQPRREMEVKRWVPPGPKKCSKPCGEDCWWWSNWIPSMYIIALGLMVWCQMSKPLLTNGLWHVLNILGRWQEDLLTVGHSAGADWGNQKNWVEASRRILGRGNRSRKPLDLPGKQSHGFLYMFRQIQILNDGNSIALLLGHQKSK